MYNQVKPPPCSGMPKKAQQLPTMIQVIGGSVPVAATVGATSAGFMPPPMPLLDPLSATIMSLNANPYIIGIFYIFLNLGGRFLSMELTKRQEWFLAQPYVRPFILFSVMFIATRNLAVAFWSTTFILSVLWLFANEDSALCLIPEWRNKKSNQVEADKVYQEKMKKLESGEQHLPHDEQDEHEKSDEQPEPRDEIDDQFNDPDN